MKFKSLIIAGGFGTRLWPLSQVTIPKQFIKFDQGYSLFQQTLIRNAKIGKPTVIINLLHKDIAHSQVKELSLDVDFIVEPLAKNTTACTVIGSLYARLQGYDKVLIIPTDHYIQDQIKYLSAINLAMAQINNHNLCTLGLQVKSASNEYGYIKAPKSRSLNNNNSILIADSFVEKPNREVSLAYFAINLLNRERYFWNSGIFIFDIDYLLSTLQSNNLILFRNIYNAFNNRQIQADQSLVFQAEDYQKIENISIDHAIVQNLKDFPMVKTEFDWYDVGNWNNLWYSSAKDQFDNHFLGNIIAEGVQNSYVVSENDKIVTLAGVDNLVVINTKEGLLIANRNKISNIKILMDLLQKRKNISNN